MPALAVTRMTLLMGALQIGDREPGVMLERIQRLMTEQLFDVVHADTGSRAAGIPRCAAHGAATTRESRCSGLQ